MYVGQAFGQFMLTVSDEGYHRCRDVCSASNAFATRDGDHVLETLQVT